MADKVCGVVLILSIFPNSEFGISAFRIICETIRGSGVSLQRENLFSAVEPGESFRRNAEEIEGDQCPVP